MRDNCDIRSSAGRIGNLVYKRRQQYGDAIRKTGAILHALYPDGVSPEHYDDLLLQVRCLDKLCRIASPNRDLQDGESPWDDVCGYSLLGQEIWHSKRGKPVDVEEQ